MTRVKRPRKQDAVGQIKSDSREKPSVGLEAKARQGGHVGKRIATTGGARVAAHGII